MKRKITIAALGAVLLLGCGTTTAKAPTEKWKPDPNQVFTRIVITEREEPYTTRIETPEPSRPEIRVPRPEPIPSVRPQKAPRSPGNNYPVPNVTGIKKYALDRVGAYQFSCLNKLWNHESGWNYRAYNKYSGAYGIPQALPGSKMKSAGADWKTNPITQIRWGLRYINGRYGSACAAWAHFQEYRWY